MIKVLVDVVKLLQVRLHTLQGMDQLLSNGRSASKKLCDKVIAQTELNNCIAFAAYKSFERIHEEHPKGRNLTPWLCKGGCVGDKEIARQSFAVLQSLMNVFTLPVIWFGIIPSAASELSAYLTHTGWNPIQIDNARD